MKLAIPLKETNYNCSRLPLKMKNVNMVYGTEAASSLGSKIWSMIPNHFKNVTSFVEFKRKIRKWKPVSCPSRLWETHIAGVQFVCDLK